MKFLILFLIPFYPKAQDKYLSSLDGKFENGSIYTYEVLTNLNPKIDNKPFHPSYLHECVENGKVWKQEIITNEEEAKVIEKAMWNGNSTFCKKPL